MITSCISHRFGIPAIVISAFSRLCILAVRAWFDHGLTEELKFKPIDRRVQDFGPANRLAI